MAQIPIDINLKTTINFLNYRLQYDKFNCFGYQNERTQFKELISNTIDFSESNSVFLVGPRKSGKTTVLLSSLNCLLSKSNYKSNTHLIYLNGIIDTDDRITLKSITKQLQLENITDGKIFGSFAENLTFLLECLKSSNHIKSKSVIFILDEVDLFCSHHNQTLLYNLFDTAQSKSAPICVIGLTCRLDVIELLEKRVKSRFSHRQIFLFPSVEHNIQMSQNFFLIPNNISNYVICADHPFGLKKFNFNIESYLAKFSKTWIQNWNNAINDLFSNKEVQLCIQLCLDPFRMITYILLKFRENVKSLNDLSVKLIKEAISPYEVDNKKLLVGDFSVVEICLLIAIKHHSEIYDRDPFNFEMILKRLKKHHDNRIEVNDRYSVMKAFQHLKNCEIIVPVEKSMAKVQTEYQLNKITLTNGQIQKIIFEYSNLPTDILQWAQNSWN